MTPQEALAEALHWPIAWPCRTENDGDCDAHGAEWLYLNEVCEWMLSARKALAAHEAQREGAK